ncbi:LytR C-terminal domain-containing protein [Cellulomonas marina]|uniref:LytR cell envelope-related transcriptional attenuator n=1 Tax=Cellulomonas marina TaxID=988821 RepID=A0A1I0WJF3_9CELL|nr:LytR C-terminal domain-containing protein [Cellulomonas marina]GIG27700.1 hypothetical protein Cma02nite_03000 [Cellulomonas marina]SFA88889.1 LytR cell envelope-related transcriptional attenuator [Cellulomonas marina]
MSTAGYPYPEDEFDAAPDPDGPRGAHRAPRPALVRWAPFLVTALVLAALAVALVSWQFSSGTPTALPGLVPGVTSTADEGATDEGATGGSADEGTDGATDGAADPAASEPAADPAATPTEAVPTEPAPSPTPTEPPAPQPDLSTTVQVFNATGITGLAGRQADRLEDAGFTDVTSGNRSRGGLSASTVLYSTDDQAATAALVASTLGVDAVALDAATAGGDVVVVLLSDPS